VAEEAIIIIEEEEAAGIHSDFEVRYDEEHTTRQHISRKNLYYT